MNMLSFVFYVASGAVLIDCPTGWTKTATSCYLLSSLTNSNVSYSSAQAACRTVTAQAVAKQPSIFSQWAIKGDLASLHSSLDLIAIVKLLKQQVTPHSDLTVWIGLNDKAQEGHFTWTDGTPVNFLAWAENQPDNWRGTQGEDCGQIRQKYTYLFNDARCSNEYPYVCGYSRCESSFGLHAFMISLSMCMLADT